MRHNLSHDSNCQSGYQISQFPRSNKAVEATAQTDSLQQSGNDHSQHPVSPQIRQSATSLSPAATFLLQFVAEKTEYALSKGLKVILCVGETLEQREANQTFDVISKQVQPVASRVKDWSKIVVAYEPVWAIGTGKVATKEQASTSCVCTTLY